MMSAFNPTVQRFIDVATSVGPLLGMLPVFIAGAAHALPTAPLAFCETYPDSAGCSGTIVSCSQCHAGPPAMNAFGGELAGAMYAANYPATAFADALPTALAAIESADSDLDGISNLEEIVMGTLPGNAASAWVSPAAPVGLENPYYDVGNFDPVFALRRVGITYCGRSPTFDEVEAIKSAAEPEAVLHTKLDACLESSYWKQEALHRLADNRIRPLKAVGLQGEIILGDYAWDYRLFSHVLSGERDARELLTADYHVREDGSTTTGVEPRTPGNALSRPIVLGSGQPLARQRRAGMITTQWFLVINTMFSPLPRTTAAQAYRSYLGLDIAKGEGIMPVANEPRDVDGKGVQAPTCAACHSTLDPLAYAFSEYDGIVIPGLFGLNRNDSGDYDNGRTDWGQDSYILGEPVGDLLQWADAAANSEAFQRNLATMFFEQALGHRPTPDDMLEFDSLWKDLPANGYSANALLHELVETAAFNLP